MSRSFRPLVVVALAAVSIALLAGCLPDTTGATAGVRATLARTLGITATVDDRKGHKVSEAAPAPATR